MAGPKSKKAAKEANTREKRLEKRAKGLADLDQLEKAVAELVRRQSRAYASHQALIPDPTR